MLPIQPPNGIIGEAAQSLPGWPASPLLPPGPSALRGRTRASTRFLAPFAVDGASALLLPPLQALSGDTSGVSSGDSQASKSPEAATRAREGR